MSLTMIQDFGDKMAVLLLKIEMLSTADPCDSNEFYTGEYIDPVFRFEELK